MNEIPHLHSAAINPGIFWITPSISSTKLANFEVRQALFLYPSLTGLVTLKMSLVYSFWSINPHKGVSKVKMLFIRILPLTMSGT